LRRVAAIAVLCLSACRSAAVNPKPTLCPTPSRDSDAHRTMLNLTWDHVDGNGVPQSPRWLVQSPVGGAAAAQAPYCLVDALDADTCGGFPDPDAPTQPKGYPLGLPQCNDSADFDAPEGWHDFTCRLNSIATLRSGPFRGHVNWLPASYVGLLYFESQSHPDLDYDFELLPLTLPRDGAGRWRLRRQGLTIGRRMPGELLPNAKTGEELARRGLDYVLHLEAKSSEAFDHFGQDWWRSLHTLVETGNTKAARALVSARPAVALGLFGLDSEHESHPELHPLYGLALQIDRPTRDAADPALWRDSWAIMVRSGGTEGWCSSWDRLHNVASRELALTLPAEVWGRVKSVAWEPEGTDLRSNVAGVQGPYVESSGGDLHIRFVWPSPTSEPVRIHGVLKLELRMEAGAEPARVTLERILADAAGDARQGGEGPSRGETSDFLERLYGSAGTPLQVQIDSLAASRTAPGNRQQLDAEPVRPGPAAPPPALREAGRCPGNAASCPEALRAAVDRFPARTWPLIARVMSDAEQAAMCALARDAQLHDSLPLPEDRERLATLLDRCPKP
jgi:hypothetical protein